MQYYLKIHNPYFCYINFNKRYSSILMFKIPVKSKIATLETFWAQLPVNYIRSTIILCISPIWVFKFSFRAKPFAQTGQTNFLGTPHSYFRCRLRWPFLLYFCPQVWQYHQLFPYSSENYIKDLVKPKQNIFVNVTWYLQKN